MKISNLCNKVCILAIEVGDTIANQVGKVQLHQIDRKELNNLVSYVDIQAEAQLVAGLSSLLPNASFLTEENPETHLAAPSDWQWIIDPLDGTTNFLHQIPVYAVSIALQYKGIIQLGVVYEPNRKECFYATLGGGAFCNGQHLQVNNTPTIAEALLATGFPYYKFEYIKEYIEMLAYAMQHSRGIRRLGAAAVDLCYVAAGRFDAFFEYSLHAWDVAAGALIVREAGGKVSDFGGGENWLHGQNIVAANSALYPDFVAAISRFFPSLAKTTLP